jgi:hypothetical protein
MTSVGAREAPLLEKIGEYRAQESLSDDTVAELVP